MPVFLAQSQIDPTTRKRPWNRIKNILCKFCDKSFKPVHGKTQRYCSRECKYEGLKKYPDICNCNECKKDFFNSQTRIPQFCSRKCLELSASKRNLRKCSGCKKVFKVFPYKIKKGWGKYCSIKCQRKMCIGENTSGWRGGVTPIHLKLRMSTRYKKWRLKVFKRDNFLCVFGGKDHGKKINADHIKPFAYFPKLRFVVRNGRTLCVDCHRKTPTYGSKCRKIYE